MSLGLKTKSPAEVAAILDASKDQMEKIASRLKKAV